MYPAITKQRSYGEVHKSLENISSLQEIGPFVQPRTDTLFPEQVGHSLEFKVMLKDEPDLQSLRRRAELIAKYFLLIIQMPLEALEESLEESLQINSFYLENNKLALEEKPWDQDAKIKKISITSKRSSPPFYFDE